MNGLNSLDKTGREYSLAATNDPIRFWRSEVKVTAGHQGGEGIHVDARVSKSHLLVYVLISMDSTLNSAYRNTVDSFKSINSCDKIYNLNAW